MRIAIMIALFLATYASASAGDVLYSCQVIEAHKLGEDALLVRTRNQTNVIGSFQVHRESGKIDGGPFSASFSTMSILDHRVGNEHNYVVVSSVKSGAAADTLVIYESDKGKKKRFLAVVGGSVFTGFCK